MSKQHLKSNKRECCSRTLIFLIFINNLPESITPSVKLFADNCLVYHTIHSSNDAIQLLEDLVQLGLCVNSWQMTLSLNKCPITHISNKRNTVCAKYTINGLPLNCVSGVNILVYQSALRCPGATILTIFVQKQENN